MARTRNKVADALRRKSSGMLMSLNKMPKPLLKEISDFNVEMITGKLATLTLQSNLLESIKLHQGKDSFLLKAQLFGGKNKEFKTSSSGVIYFKEKICIPNFEFLKKQIMSHETPYSIHPGATKMYKDLKESVWWPNMKNKIANFVSKCLTCQKVKVEHRQPGGDLQKIELPECKWEQTTMDFVVRLPKTCNAPKST